MLHNSAQPLRIVSSPIVTIPCLKELKAACCSCCRGPSEQTSDSFLAHRLERLRSFKRLVENFQAVDARYHGRGRQVKRIMQALDGRHGLALKDEGIPHRFHSEHPDLVRDQVGENLMFETPKMCVHDVQWHLHGVKTEFVGRSDLQHPEMNERILMPGKSDVTDLSGSLGFYHGLDCATGCEDPVWVFQSNNLMELHQVDAIRLQPLQRFVDLPGGGLPRPAVDLRHEEDSLAIAVTQRPPHADFAGAAIIIPAVVHEGESPVDGAPDNRYTLCFVSLFADMIPAQADGRDFFSSPPQSALGHSLLSLGHQSLWAGRAQNRSRRGGFYERASAHHDVDLARCINSACFINDRAHKRSPVDRSIDQTDHGVHYW